MRNLAEVVERGGRAGQMLTPTEALALTAISTTC